MKSLADGSTQRYHQNNNTAWKLLFLKSQQQLLVEHSTYHSYWHNKLLDCNASANSAILRKLKLVLGSLLASIACKPFRSIWESKSKKQ
eukprot:6459221-Amphidinium_carterae.1